MSVPAICLDRQAIARILPHTGQALVIDTVQIETPTQATGYFLVRADDARIVSHFGVMPGVLIAEFTHLTGAVLLMHGIEEAIIPALNETHLFVAEAVLPGDDLMCKVALDNHSGRAFSFSAVVHKVHSRDLVATVSFTGMRIPRRIFERQMKQRAQAAATGELPIAERMAIAGLPQEHLPGTYMSRP